MGIRTVGKGEINGLLGKKMIHIGDEDNLVGAFYLSPLYYNIETFGYIKIREDIRQDPKAFVIVVTGLCIFRRMNIILDTINGLVRNKDVEILFYYDDKIHAQGVE